MKKIAWFTLMLISMTAPSFSFEVRSVDIHGFVSRGMLWTDYNNYIADSERGSLKLGETGINFSVEPTDDLRIGLQLLARDMGNLGDNEIKLDWAFADYRWKNWLGLRVGRLKMPLGLYNETRDLDMLRTSILLPQGVYPEMWRDTLQSLDGAGFYGELPLGLLGGMRYQLQAGVMSMTPDGGIARSLMDSLPIEIKDIHLREAYLASLSWRTPLDGLGLAGSMLTSSRFALSGPINDSLLTIVFQDIRLWFWSAEYIRGDLTLAGEFSAIESKSDIMPRKKMNCLGYYLNASYRFTEWFEAGLYYTVFYADKNDKDGRIYASTRPWPNAAQLPPEYRMQPDFMAWNKDLTLSLRFDLNEFWLFKLESHFMNGTFGIPVGENLPDPGNPGKGLKEDWVLLAAKITYSF